MLKKYKEKNSLVHESKKGPSTASLKFILSYSKSLEVKKTRNENLLIQLN
jgi:hypothetical protein